MQIVWKEFLGSWGEMGGALEFCIDVVASRMLLFHSILSDIHSDATCTWSIMADNSSLRAVRLDIVRIDLEFSPNCSFDSITIYDGQ